MLYKHHRTVDGAANILEWFMVNPHFAVLSLTEAAAARARKLIEAAGRPVAGLRVGIKKGGCAGMSYTMDLAEEVRPADEVIEDQGVKILIEPKDLMFLLGTKLDFETTTLQSSFTFQNPNQTGACGCGESVSITPAAEAEGKAI
jgi:iron-sulfur cluster assembly protein